MLDLFSHKTLFHKILSLLVFCILTSFVVSSYAQNILNYGDNSLSEKQIQYGKYTGKITPHIIIKNKYSFNLTIEIEIKWLDKKDRQIEAIDGFVYLFGNSNNLNDFKLQDARKNVLKYDFPPSINIIPEKNFRVADIKNGFVEKKSNPVKIDFNEHYAYPIELELVLYFGKIKKDEMIITDNSPTLKWKFNLPERKSDLGLSCEQLIRKYTNEFENSKPDFSWTRYEDKYDLNLIKETTKDEWLELQRLVNEYKDNLNESKIILAELSKNKDTIFCKELNEIKGKIRHFLTLEKRVDVLLINIENSITKSSESGSESAPVYISPGEFKKNAQEIERYYTALFNLEIQSGRINGDNPRFVAYKDSVIAIGELQDSLLKVAGDAIENPVVRYQLKRFKQSYTGSVEIIKRYKPESVVIHETTAEEEDVDAEPDKGGRRFSYWWIIIPVLLIIIVAIGLKKFFPHLMKIKKADKIRGRFKR